MMSNQAVTGVLEVGVHNTSQKLALVDFLTELLNTPDKDLKSVLKMRRFKAKLEYAVPAAEAFSIPEESLQTVRERLEMIAARLEKKEIVEARRRKLRKSGFFTKLRMLALSVTWSTVASIVWSARDFAWVAMIWM